MSKSILVEKDFIQYNYVVHDFSYIFSKRLMQLMSLNHYLTSLGDLDLVL